MRKEIRRAAENDEIKEYKPMLKDRRTHRFEECARCRIVAGFLFSHLLSMFESIRLRKKRAEQCDEDSRARCKPK